MLKAGKKCGGHTFLCYLDESITHLNAAIAILSAGDDSHDDDNMSHLMALLLDRFTQFPAVDNEKGFRKGQQMYIIHRVNSCCCKHYDGKCSVVMGHTNKYVVLLFSPHSGPTLCKGDFNLSLAQGLAGRSLCFAVLWRPVAPKHSQLAQN